MTDGLQWVAQKHARGCAIACTAMLLGISYDDAMEKWNKQFPRQDDGQDWETSGTRSIYLDQVLAANGIAVARLYRVPHHEPFENCYGGHLRSAMVAVSDQSPCSHYVVVRPDDFVLDPITPDMKRLTDYFRIHEIAAVIELERI